MPRAALSARGVAHAWLDPEFWGPEGLGCRLCHERPPIVERLCFECLARCFRGWSEDRLIRWPGGQRATLNRQKERRAALEAWPHDLGPVREYRRKYGVWLLEISEEQAMKLIGER